ncbi:hypothetical protein ACU6U9_20045 [Pseudomonas sp. HK3]
MIFKYPTQFLCAALSLSFFHSTSFAASCPSSTSNVGSISYCLVNGSASSIQLNFISGFDSTESVAVQGGNNGATIGEQRRLGFIKAAEILSTQITTTQTIVVDASFSSLPCDSGTAVLGSAGASDYVAFNDADKPLPASAIIDTFYPIALFNALKGTDIYPGDADITANFNSNLGGNSCLLGGDWYYGFDDNTGNLTGFLTVLLHEITHGLGFSSLVDLSTGEKSIAISNDGSSAVIDDVFSNFLYIKSEGKTWGELGTSSSDNLKRKNSATATNNLYWNGSQANTLAENILNNGFSDNDNSSSFTNGDHIQMYTPSSLEQGSSVSHFDTSVSPNELMEPNLALNACDIGLAFGVLKDLGWSIVAPNKPAFYLNINCDTVESGQTFNNLFNGNTVKITPVSSSSNYNYSLTYEGQSADSLLTQTSNGVFVNTQSSGEFAGEYTLTISNGTDPDISITINRPLRVIWSSEALLNNEAYTLTIEGGAANSTYDLTQSQVNVINFLNQQNQSTTSVTATNNAQKYNPALLNITSNNVVAPLNVTTTVKSQSNAYADVSDDITVYPALMHTFTVQNSSGTAIANTAAKLPDSTVINAVGIEKNYVSDTTGKVSINLPNTSDRFSIVFSKSGYSDQILTVSSSQTTHTVILNETQNITDNKPKFGSGGGGSLPIGFITLFGLLILRRLRP